MYGITAFLTYWTDTRKYNLVASLEEQPQARDDFIIFPCNTAIIYQKLVQRTGIYRHM